MANPGDINRMDIVEMSLGLTASAVAVSKLGKNFPVLPTRETATNWSHFAPPVAGRYSFQTFEEYVITERWDLSSRGVEQGKIPKGAKPWMNVKRRRGHHVSIRDVVGSR